VTEDPQAEEKDMTEGRAQPIPRAAGGYAFEGEGFYVWDEDAREARLAGEALFRVVDARSAPRRGAGSQSPANPVERA
jgi:hypothetical protein